MSTDGVILADDPRAIRLDNITTPGLLPIDNKRSEAPTSAVAGGAANIFSLDDINDLPYSTSKNHARGIEENVLRWQARLLFPHPDQMADILDHLTGHGLTRVHTRTY